MYESPPLGAEEIPVVLRFPDERSLHTYEGTLLDNLESASEALEPLSFRVLESEVSEHAPEYEWGTTPLDSYETHGALGIYFVHQISWGPHRYCGLSLDFSGFCERGILLANEHGQGTRPGVLLHEIGHVLGLDDGDDPSGFMWPGPGEVGEVVTAEQLERMRWEAAAYVSCLP